MATGLQVFDASGNLSLDATTRCGCVVLIQRITGGSGTFYNDRLALGTPFVTFLADFLIASSANSRYTPPNVSASGNSVSFSYPAGTPVPGYLIAGVY